MDRARLAQEYRRLWAQTDRVDPSTQITIATEEKRLSEKSVEELLSIYRQRPKNVSPLRRSQTVATYDRDPMVVALRKKLAGNCCEVDGCTSLAFENDAGELFVEVHHLVPLAEGGEDVLPNTVAVCSTHHRYLHIGRGRLDLTTILQARRKLENALTKPIQRHSYRVAQTPITSTEEEGYEQIVSSALAAQIYKGR